MTKKQVSMTKYKIFMIPLSIKTQREWTEPEGYKFLVQWTNLVLLRHLVRLFTSSLPLDTSSKRPLEFRLKAQMDDAARSAVSTLEEGWKRPDTKAYLDFLGFSQASLEEIKGDVYRSLEDGFLKSKPGSSLKDLGIDLREFKEMFNPHRLKEVRGKILKELSSKACLPAGRDPLNSSNGTLKGPVAGPDPLSSSSNDPLNSFSGPLREPIPLDYPPLKALRPEDLTFEMFLELINKTDFLLRGLVKSLQESGEIKLESRKNPNAWIDKQGDKWLVEQYIKMGWVKDGDLWRAPKNYEKN